MYRTLHIMSLFLLNIQGFAAGVKSGEIQWANSQSSSTTSVDTLLDELIENVKQGEQIVVCMVTSWRLLTQKWTLYLSDTPPLGHHGLINHNH